MESVFARGGMVNLTIIDVRPAGCLRRPAGLLRGQGWWSVIQRGDGWTVVLRRHCGDDPGLDYREVCPRLQLVRWPYPIAAGRRRPMLAARR
jgi:hypothetical protein